MTETWAWLTEPVRLERWLASTAVAGSSPGVDLVVEIAGEDGRDVRVEIRTLEIEPESRWVVAWQESEAGWPVATRLTLSLETREGRTGVSVLQQGFEHLPLSDCLTIWERYRHFWREALERLAIATGQQ